jgi:hypothetical protein
MKRKAGTMMMLAALSGCMSGAPNAGPGAFMNHVNQDVAGTPPPCGPEGGHCGATLLHGAPGLIGGDGQPVLVTAPPRQPQVTPESLARATVSQGLPPGIIDQIDRNRRGGFMQTSASGPMGGVIPAGGPMMGAPPLPGMPGFAPPGAVAAAGAITAPGQSPFPIQRTSVRFVGPSGMKISWYGPTGDGKNGFGGEYLTAPGRYNFLQAAIYRLKMTDIPLRAGLDLYPTLEVVPANAKTATFLAHTSVPVSITEEDLNQVAAGNFVVKVIYLPDPQFQDLAATGAEEIISSRLEPGADPIAEALRRGSILLVLRMGNILLELPNTPPMDAPSPFQARPPMMPGAAMPPGMGGPTGPMPPFGLTGNPHPGMMPPGMMPPGMMPPGMMPPGVMSPGIMPPAMTPPLPTPPAPTAPAPSPAAQAQPGRVPQSMAPQGTLPPDLMPKTPVPSSQPVAPGVPVGQILPPLAPTTPVAPTSAAFGTQAGK